MPSRLPGLELQNKDSVSGGMSFKLERSSDLPVLAVYSSLAVEADPVDKRPVEVPAAVRAVAAQLAAWSTVLPMPVAAAVAADTIVEGPAVADTDLEHFVAGTHFDKDRWLAVAPH